MKTKKNGECIVPAGEKIGPACEIFQPRKFGKTCFANLNIMLFPLKIGGGQITVGVKVRGYERGFFRHEADNEKNEKS